MIEPLREDFHVVVPSLPGYGWSGPTTEPGWDVQRIADAWATLMARLGYDTLRRAGWRLGRDDLGAARGHRRRARDRPAQQHAARLPRRRERHRAHRRGDRRPRGRRRVHDDGRRVPGDPGQEPADARLRPHRFAGRARGLDRREVPRLDRQQRQPRRRGHARPDPHEPHRVLGDQDDQLVDPALLRVAAHRALRPDRRVRAASRPRPRCSRRRSSASREAYAETRFNLVRYTRFDRGGHFAALEEPDLLVDDIKAFFRGAATACTIS